MATTATLDVLVKANTSQLSAGLDNATKKVQDFGKAANQAVSSGGGAAAASALGPVGIAAAAVGTAVGTIVGAAKGAFDYLSKLAGIEFHGFDLTRELQGISAIGKAASVFGTTAEEMSKISYAAKKSGLDLDSFTEASKHLVRELGNAERGSKEAIGAFNSLNINFEKFSKLSFSEQLQTAADRIKGMRDPAEKMAVAMQLFGRSGQEMLPFLNKGAEGIQELMKKAEESGQVVSTKSVEDYRTFKKSIAEIKDTVDGVFRQIAIAVTPYLAQLGQKIQEWVEKGKAWFNEWRPVFNQFKDVAKSALDTVMQIATTAWNMIVEGGRKVLQFFGVDFSNVWQNLKVGITVALTVAEVAIKQWADLAVGAMALAASKIIKAVLDLGNVLGVKLPGIALAAAQAFNRIILQMASAAKDNLDSMMEWIKSGGKKDFKLKLPDFGKEFGQAMKEIGGIIEKERPLTPLEKQLNAMADFVGKNFNKELGEKLAERLKALNAAPEGVKNAVEKKIPDVAGKVEVGLKSGDLAQAQAKGTTEAMSTIIKARNVKEDEQLAVQKQQLAQMNKIAEALAGPGAAVAIKLAQM